MNNVNDDKKIIITEHAFLRFFDRVLGFNLEEVYNWILPEKLLTHIIKTGDGVYLTEKYKILVKNNRVVTVLSHTQSSVYSQNSRKMRKGEGQTVRNAVRALKADKVEEQVVEEYYKQKFRL